jgi:ABC-2 type transport system permease protein
MASQWAVVARREFLERVRTKWFIVVTVLGPLAMIGLVVLPAWLGHRAAKEQVIIDVVDRSDHGLTAAIAATAPLLGSRLEVHDAHDADPASLEADIRDERIQGYLILPDDVLTGGQVVYRGDNATNFEFLARLGVVVNQVVKAARGAQAGLDADQIAAMLRPVDIDAKHTTGTGEAKSATESFMVGYLIAFILYMSIMLYGVNVMRSVVMEKTSRVVEIVVSATRPGGLMLGKVFGVGAVGLLQLGIWATVALLLIQFHSQILGMLGVASSGGGLPALPDLALADLALVLVYFLLGYFLYAALFAGLGAMVNSEQEAQQVQTPVVMLLVVPIVCAQLVANDPRGTAAEVLTLIPFASPVLMPMRWLLGGASPLDLALSLATLVAAIAGAVWLAARIYRIGILSYGKRPSLRELARWIRSA